MIEAAAGFGKTVLAASFARARKLPTIWLCLYADPDGPDWFRKGDW